MATTAQLDALYEIHQRSQITGVPTSEVRAAKVEAGLDPDDPFAISRTLREAGYQTGMPTREAVLKYGSTKQQGDSGNQSFITGGESYNIAAAGEETYNKYLEDLGVLQIKKQEQDAEARMAEAIARLSSDFSSALAEMNKPTKVSGSTYRAGAIGAQSGQTLSEQQIARGEVPEGFSKSKWRIPKRKGTGVENLMNRGTGLQTDMGKGADKIYAGLKI